MKKIHFILFVLLAICFCLVCQLNCNDDDVDDWEDDDDDEMDDDDLFDNDDDDDDDEDSPDESCTSENFCGPLVECWGYADLQECMRDWEQLLTSCNEPANMEACLCDCISVTSDCEELETGISECIIDFCVDY